MPFLAGQKVTAAALNRIQPVKKSAKGTLLSLSTAETDIPGAVVNVVTTTANAKFTVWGTFEVLTITAGAAVLGRLSVDGSTDAEYPKTVNGGAAQSEGMSWQWSGVLATAGAHVFKLRANRDTAAGSQSINTSKITVEIAEVP